MAFPATPLDLTAELYVSGAWTDITADVFTRGGGGVSITRGRADEGTRTDPSRAGFSLRNTSGKYSPRNPTGVYYGQLGRNTPVRFSVAGASTYLALPGDTLSKAHAPDAAALGITGDIDIRIDLELLNWREAVDLAAKYQTAGDQRSWALYLHGNGDGIVGFSWSSAGSSATTIDRQSTVPIPAPASGRQALRVTLDVNNGGTSHDVTFYIAPTIAGPWTRLGDTVVGAGTTSIFDSVAGIELGDAINLTALPVKGKLYAFELRNGIDGTVVANPDFTVQTPGAGSFADTASAPNTWTIEGDAELTNRQVRFAGEVPSWPPRWDVSGTDVWVTAEAAGIQRRLGQGHPVEGSVMYRAMTLDAPSVVAYWPLEDAAGSTSLAAASSGTGPLQVVGEPELSSYTGFIASAPLLVLAGAQLTGAAPAYTPGNLTQVRWLMAVPVAGDADNQSVVTFYTTGSIRRWECHYGTGGTLGLRAFDAGGTQIFDSGDVAFAVNGLNLMVSVELTQDGADVDWLLGTLEPGASSGLTWSGTATGQTVGRVGTVVVSPNGGIADTAIGHLSVQATITSLFDLGDQMNAWIGETAGRRIVRLCAEEGITCVARGDIDATAQLGAQTPGTLLDLLAECAETDGGILYEPRELLGLAYRTRESLYNQAPAVELDYEGGHLVPPLEPTDDDQQVRNDITVTRREGSSARAVLEDGPLSTQAPPDGVGRYDEQIAINPRYDALLADHASWRLHVATVDETRYPVVSLNLAKLHADGEGALAEDIAAMDVGDLLTIDNPPAWLPPGLISQLGLGFAEFLAHFDWDVSVNCVPASPYEVAAYDVQGRYGPHSTVTAEALDTTETGIDITTPVGPLWSTTATGYQIVIGGEVMTVTAVSAPVGTAQTLTVTRSVNGVVKAHASGVAVELAEPAIYAL
ncbi:hypothetical protein ACQEVF_59560 [Nonomuraea polychroma]|uniref:hypothetical protein n=1 Tax=Nonomuraea polychroma TaxID=46176 RepID=UPI003D902DC6